MCVRCHTDKTPRLIVLSERVCSLALCSMQRTSFFHSHMHTHMRIATSRDKSSMSAKWHEIVGLRRKYLSPSLRTFEAYDKPVVLEKGSMQYMWDSEGNKFIDLLGQNLCISVGHCHPKVYLLLFLYFCFGSCVFLYRMR